MVSNIHIYINWVLFPSEIKWLDFIFYQNKSDYMDPVNATQAINTSINTSLPILKEVTGLEPNLFFILLFISVIITLLLHIKETIKVILTIVVIMVILVLIALYMGGKI